MVLKRNYCLGNIIYDALIPKAVSFGCIKLSTETGWASTVFTLDGYIAIGTVVDGIINERLRILSFINVSYQHKKVFGN